jgi:hypothetical protein
MVMDVSWVVGIANAAQTTTSGATTTTTAASTTTTAATGGGGPTVETAAIAALAVIVAGVFGFLGARGAAKLTSTASREVAGITSGASREVAGITSVASREAAKIASDAQLAVLQQQLDDAASTRAQERRFALIDRRLKRHEETILKLQDALAGLAVAVKTLARARSSEAAAKGPKGWEEPLDEQHAAVDSAFQEAYKLLQRLPRGSQAWTADWAETWAHVQQAVDGQHRSVLASKDEAEQKDQLQNFEDAIHYSHDQLGQALERLDEEIQRNLREEENALSQQETKPEPTQPEPETKPEPTQPEPETKPD